MSRAGSRISWWNEALETGCLNIAHRGARAYEPENTMPAFELAQRLGAHMLELDVHLTADGQVVVHHDDDVLRCTDAAGRFPGRESYFISDFSLAELRELDAGSWFADGASAVRIPSLDEVLEVVAADSTFVNIELKMIPRMYRELVPRVLECVDRARARHLVLVTSFDHRALLDVRARTKEIATGVLSSEPLVDPVEYLASLDADAYHPSCDALGVYAADGTLDVATIDALRAADKQINVWTCNEPDSMQRLVEAGVTGIITDYPDRLRTVLIESSRFDPE
jgi:glycerophosphoryl diester phosphodiesterase